ncbi:MAG: hypothetical protein ACHBN1_05750 [Heteroscytonema crispum UTEX LB 1556]
MVKRVLREGNIRAGNWFSRWVDGWWLVVGGSPPTNNHPTGEQLQQATGSGPPHCEPTTNNQPPTNNPSFLSPVACASVTLPRAPLHHQQTTPPFFHQSPARVLPYQGRPFTTNKQPNKIRQEHKRCLIPA